MFEFQLKFSMTYRIIFPCEIHRIKTRVKSDFQNDLEFFYTLAKLETYSKLFVHSCAGLLYATIKVISIPFRLSSSPSTTNEFASDQSRDERLAGSAAGLNDHSLEFFYGVIFLMNIRRP